YYDYQQQLYGRTDPSTETIVSLSGGANNTRYFVSAHDRQDAGIAINTGARRQSVRANLDQAIGSKLTMTVGSNVMHSFSQRGISNNDNSFSSPMYGLGYTPAIAPLATRDAAGNFPLNPFPAGYKGSANPFQTFNLLKNNEDVFRMILNGRVNYSAYSDSRNNVNLSFTGGADRFSNENYIVAPPTLQFQRLGSNQGGTFPGTVIQGDGTSLQTNATVGGTWAFTGSGWNSTFQSGLQVEGRKSNDYNITGRGLGPQQVNAAGAANTSVTHGQSAVVNQAYYLQEEAQFLNEKLYVSAAVRGERSSVNGDRNKIFTFPRYAASYRWTAPKYIPFTDEIKFRANFGESGNQPNYGDRDLTIASYGLIGGLAGFGVPGSVGNTNIEPERLAENEYGIDWSVLKERAHLEVTYFRRNITNLLVRPVLAASTGITQTVVNGGEMESKGWEIGLSYSVLQRGNLSWLTRVNWTQNSARITSFPEGVLPFTIGAAGGFGNAYGRLRFAPGFSASQIYGNVRNADGTTTVGAPIADANPTYLMSFSNEWSYKRLSLSALVDYRRGGAVSNMTNNLFDEGYNSWDYDKPSPDGTKPLGQYRYDSWHGGTNTGAYIQNGSYTKVREINAGYELSNKWVTMIPGARSARASVSGRNLWIISGYHGADPEVDNGGSQVARFVDLAPFPPSRSVAFSLDIGF
ncbi:MAG: SusC/RagA family TonB-linked outer membrane protein, partial [Gemmatimonadaceae bacterium]